MPTNTETALVISGELPPMPCQLQDAGAVARVNQLTADAAALTKLVTPADANHAAQLLREIAGFNRDIEKMRLELGRPFRELIDRIGLAAKAQTTKLTAAEKTIRAALTAFQVEQERIQREEAERQRREQERLAAEARRLQEEQARAAREAAERAAAAAKVAEPVAADDDGLADLAEEIHQDDIAERQAAIAAQAVKLAQTRAVVAPKPVGVSYGTRLKYEVTDITRLTTNLVITTPNDAEIKNLYVTRWKAGDPVPTVPGIRFTPEKYTIVRR